MKSFKTYLITSILTFSSVAISKPALESPAFNISCNEITGNQSTRDSASNQKQCLIEKTHFSRIPELSNACYAVLIGESIGHRLEIAIADDDSESLIVKCIKN